jgi:hypothetical protein
MIEPSALFLFFLSLNVPVLVCDIKRRMKLEANKQARMMDVIGLACISSL